MANSLLIPELPSLRRLWLFPISIVSFSPHCRSYPWGFQDLVRPSISRMLMNAHNASWTLCAIHGMQILIADDSILEASRFDCSSRVIKQVEGALLTVISGTWLPVCSKQWRTSFICMTSLAPSSSPLTNHAKLAFNIGTEYTLNLIISELNFLQLRGLIHISNNDLHYG